MGKSVKRVLTNREGCANIRKLSVSGDVKHLKDIIKDWGYSDKDLHSEPFTDVIQIREKTGVTCMNFGNGGYEAHMYTEYMILEDTDHALGMGIERITNLKYRVKDLRMFSENDMRFLDEFKSAN